MGFRRITFHMRKTTGDKNKSERFKLLDQFRNYFKRSSLFANPICRQKNVDMERHTFKVRTYSSLNVQIK